MIIGNWLWELIQSSLWETRKLSRQYSRQQLPLASKYMSWKDYKDVAADSKQIYQSSTEDKTLLALERFAERWGRKYPHMTRTSDHGCIKKKDDHADPELEGGAEPVYY